MTRLLCALALLANDLLFTALNALFCGAVLYLTFDRFWTGAAIGTAIFLGIILLWFRSSAIMGYSVIAEEPGAARSSLRRARLLTGLVRSGLTARPSGRRTERP